MRIVVADSQHKVRRALKVLLKRQTGMEVVAEASVAQDLLDKVNSHKPELVLLHWRLGGAQTAEFVAELRKASPGLRVVALSARTELRPAALAAGVDAFVCKMDAPERLLCVLQELSAQELAT